MLHKKHPIRVGDRVQVATSSDIYTVVSIRTAPPRGRVVAILSNCEAHYYDELIALPSIQSVLETAIDTLKTSLADPYDILDELRSLEDKLADEIKWGWNSGRQVRMVTSGYDTFKRALIASQVAQSRKAHQRLKDELFESLRSPEGMLPHNNNEGIDQMDANFHIGDKVQREGEEIILTVIRKKWIPGDGFIARLSDGGCNFPRDLTLITPYS